jgi:hypothetical protein
VGSQVLRYFLSFSAFAYRVAYASSFGAERKRHRLMSNSEIALTND